MRDQSVTDSLVDKLDRSDLGWYEDDDHTKDTKAQVLYYLQIPHKIIEDPFSKNPLELWQCPNCKQAVSYAGIDLGHKINWKPYLKNAGVQNKEEAKMVYNDLNNLTVECGTCNRGHAFETGPSGAYNDVPLKGDFPRNSAGKEQYQYIMDSYQGADLDSYDEGDSFIDDSEYEPMTLVEMKPITLTNDLGGIKAGVSETFWGGAQVLLTGNAHGAWVEVKIIRSDDFRLPEGVVVWARGKHLKKGTVTTY